jgi:ubiquinone/menaquinone biosynthesis C-methylase UbiE
VVSRVTNSEINQLSEVEQPTERQEREREYHRRHAEKYSHLADEPIAFDLLQKDSRRWWNSYWRMYDFVLDLDLRGKRIFVPGCGFGADACRLAALGAEVYASDLSPEIIGIARHRASKVGFGAIEFAVGAAERTGYPDDFFDAALIVDVLHHVDIPSALQELRRIMKPGATVITHEIYTNTIVQRIRASRLVDRVIYSRLCKLVYGTNDPYITEDERKLDQTELRLIASKLDQVKTIYFGMVQGRLFPSRMVRLSQMDRLALKVLGPLGAVFAGRVVLVGSLRK